MTEEDDPYEAGIGFTVRLAKGDFTGRDALARRKECGAHACPGRGSPSTIPRTSCSARRRQVGRFGRWLRAQRGVRVLRRPAPDRVMLPVELALRARR